MKISTIICLNLLYLIPFVKTDEGSNETCISNNVTYALCTVDGTNITIVSESFSAKEFGEECHEHFVEEALGKQICGEESEERSHPTSAQRYGYGFLATFIICALSLGGLLAFPLIYRVAFQYVLATFTALAVGTLFGDAMFHLIPFALGLHSHESDEHAHEEEDSSITVPIYQWRLFTAVMVLYGFYLLEIFLHWLTSVPNSENAVHSHGHNHGGQQMNIQPFGISQTSVSNKVTQSNINQTTASNGPKVPRVTGWMVIIGDAIHNFADGLAMGAAFSEDLMLGLTTTIAIGCHELPHEFGDYAILIQSGFSHCRALFWNFISALTAFIGFFVGAAVSTNEGVRQWIFTVTIGMFLYIALVDLLPTLLPHGHIQWKRFVLVNIGFLVGIAIMFVLAVFEDKLVDLGN